MAAYGPSLLYGIATGAILPVIALSARDLGGSVAIAALIITLTGVGSLATNIPATMITSRFGERWALVGAALWCSTAMVVAAFATQLWVFALAIFMVGMAGSVFGLARQSYLTEAVPLHFRARALSTLAGVSRIGMFIGPFIAAGVMALVGISGAYWVGASATLVAAVLSVRVPDLGAPSRRSGAERILPPTVRYVLRSHVKVFLTVGVGVLLIAAVRATRQGVLPLWAESIGLDASATALIYGLSGAVDMLIFYPAGKVMDVKGRVWTAVPCMLIMAAALVVIPFTAGPGWFTAAALLIGFGNGVGSGIVMTLGADYSPSPGRPQFLGIWRFMSDLGTMAGPGLLSLFTAFASLAVGIWATAGIGFLAAVVLGYWIPRVRRP